MDPRDRDERGQVAPLLAVLVLLVGVVALLLGRIGGEAVARARARTAADAAALAGAVDGRGAAGDIAAANGARLQSFTAVGTDTRVVVAVGSAEASASARTSGGLVGDAATRGLAPVMLAALARAEQLLGEPVPITSGYRSYAQQALLWQHRDANPYPVAPPGTSMHERGLAVDVPSKFVDRLAAVAEQAGLCQPLPTSDPVHFEPCPASRNP